MCEPLSSSPLAASMETEEVCFFARDALPKLSLKLTSLQQVEKLTKLTPNEVNLADLTDLDRSRRRLVAFP
jgi:hypothetical protein